MYQNNIYIHVSELLSPGDKRLLMDSGCFAAD